MEIDTVATAEMTEEQVVVEPDPLALSFEEAEDCLEMQRDRAVGMLRAILQSDREDEDALRLKEQCISKLTKVYADSRQFPEVMNLLKSSNALFSSIAKSRTAKIVRGIMDTVALVPDSVDIQVELCRDVIEWCKAEKRTFLRQRVEAKLAVLMWTKKESAAALVLVTSLLRELKKLDDKQMLTETHLVESRIYHSLENVPKAKAALTASRTAANSIYVTPLLQAELDEMSGILQCEEGDSATAFSYFLESFDAFDKCKDGRAMSSLKYMCLCKVLSNAAGEVPSILANKNSIKYLGPEVESMAAVARAAKDRSLEKFQEAEEKYAQYLKTDDLISHHLELLYEKMLEANLLKIISPFSCVEISRVADLIKLPAEEVEKKLSQMILDKSFSGILDQGKGHLIVFEPTQEDALAGRAKGLHKITAPVAATAAAKTAAVEPAK